MNTYRFPIKCMNCGLHFNVYSWDENWTERHKAFCPECGSKKSFVLGIEGLNSEIYEHVGAVMSDSYKAYMKSLSTSRQQVGDGSNV